MPQLLSEDQFTATVLGDNGQEITIAKSPEMAPILNNLRSAQGLQNPAAGNGLNNPMAGLAPKMVGLGEQRDYGTATPSETAAAAPIALNDAPIQPDIAQAAPSVDQARMPVAPAAPTPTTPGMPRGMGMGTTTSSLSQGMSKEARNLFDSGLKKQTEATNAIADVEIAKAANEKESLDATTNYLKEYNQRIAANEAARQAKIAQVDADIAKIERETGDAKVDPQRLFGDMSTAGKFSAAIGLALGALGQGLTGKENPAIGVMERAIQRDIDAQKANIANSSDRIKAKRGSLDSYLRIFDDQRTAEAAEAARQMDIFKNQLKGLNLENAPAEIKAKRDATIGELDAKIGQARAQVEQWKQTTMTEPIKGAMPTALPEGTAKEVKGTVDSLNALDKIRDLKQKVGTGPLKGRWMEVAQRLGINAPDEAVFQAKLTDMLGGYVRSISGAAATDAEREFIKGATPSAILEDGSFDAVLNNMYDRLESSLATSQELARQQNQMPIDTKALRKAGGGTIDWSKEFGYQPRK